MPDALKVKLESTQYKPKNRDIRKHRSSARNDVLHSSSVRSREMAVNSVIKDHRFAVVRQRIQGIPRTSRELNYSLQALSVMRSAGWHQSLGKYRSIDH